MTENYAYWLLVSSLLFIILSFFLNQKTNSTVQNKRMIHWFNLVGLTSSIFGVSALNLSNNVTDFIEIQGVGHLFKFDVLSIIMFIMIQIISYIVLMYSNTYLEGDPNRHTFLKRMILTIISVQLMVSSGNLISLFTFWVTTSLTLNQLIKFYQNRKNSLIAAKKKNIVSRIGDAFFILAISLIYKELNTFDLSLIFSKISEIENLTFNLQLAGIFLVLTAIFKSAQIPTHGWLIEVMEAPTPVSALLHAGILNAGPFLMIRMAYLIDISERAQQLIIIIGGLTALIASIIFMTQPAVKTMLVYSSVAHMGFSLTLCGLGLYPAALLHLVAHSFYKAHAFLSSGSIIESVKAAKINPAERKFSSLKVILSFGLAIVIFIGLTELYTVHILENFPLMITSIVIMSGSSILLVLSLDSNSNFKVVFNSVLYTALIGTSFIFLESGASLLIKSSIPELTEMPYTSKVITIVIISLYVLTIFAQFYLKRIKESSLGNKLGIHFKNGLYLNTYFDKLIGSYKL